MTAGSSSVRVVFFASLREITGEAEVQLKAGNLDSLLSQLKERFSAEVFAELVADNVRIALNQELLDENTCAAQTMLEPGCEVAFLPPVTGG